jgi:hypothetical protein
MRSFRACAGERGQGAAAHTGASHPYTDCEALDTAKSVAGWV